jgi:hypothetical protein
MRQFLSNVCRQGMTVYGDSSTPKQIPVRIFWVTRLKIAKFKHTTGYLVINRECRYLGLFSDSAARPVNKYINLRYV